MNFLITDLNIKLDGHKLGFIKNILHFLEENQDQNQYYFLCNYSDDFSLMSSAKNIKILTTPKNLSFEVKGGYFKYARKCAAEFDYIHQTATQNQVERLILLDFDPYQISVGLLKTNYQINGIWFRPHALRALDTLEYGRKNNFFKYCVAAVARLNTNLRKVFILNDKLKPLHFNNYRSIYHYLPDPVFDYPLDANYDLRKDFDIPKDNLILLQFGNIDDRKNTENIIKALELLPDHKAQQVTLLVIGKHAPNYASKLFLLKSPSSMYQLKNKDEFVSDTILEAIFAQSDVIIRMNVGFYGSSGVVGIAARHNKVCIVSDTGVMAREVNEYGLGKTIAPDNIKSIKDSIEEFLENRSKTQIDGSKYTQSHNIRAFVETLLG